MYNAKHTNSRICTIVCLNAIYSIINNNKSVSHHTQRDQREFTLTIHRHGHCPVRFFFRGAVDDGGAVLVILARNSCLSPSMRSFNAMISLSSVSRARLVAGPSDTTDVLGA